MSHSSCKVVGLRRGKWHHFQFAGWCCNGLSHHLHETTASEEDIKGVHAGVLDLNLCVEGYTGNFQLARFLGEEDILSPYGCAIVTSVDTLVFERHLLFGIQLLHVESVQLRNLSCYLLYVHQGVKFVGKQHGLLLIYLGLVGRYGHVKVFCPDVLRAGS